MTNAASAAVWSRESAAIDPSRDLLPVVMAGLVAWWVTVRPVAAAADMFLVRFLAGLSLLGVGLMAAALLRRWPHFLGIAITGFIVPSSLTWLTGDATGTSLLEPVEIFVGGVAWVVLGVLFMRPQAVSVPQGSEGVLGPTLGAGDDIARAAVHELDIPGGDPPPKLTPRKPIPWLATSPLYVALLLCAAVGWRVLRVGTAHPDRAVLARAIGATIMIALLTCAGELVEVRYVPRVAASVGERLWRGSLALAVALMLLFVYAVVSGRLT